MIFVKQWRDNIMWICRDFSLRGHVINFLNKNNHLINSVSITRNILANDKFQYCVFFRLNDGVFEHDLDKK